MWLGVAARRHDAGYRKGSTDIIVLNQYAGELIRPCFSSDRNKLEAADVVRRVY